MTKNQKNIAITTAILIGCGVAIGAMATKIYLDKGKEIREEINRLKNETDFKLSKEFLKELKDELKAEIKSSKEEVVDTMIVEVNENAPIVEAEALSEDGAMAETAPESSAPNEDIETVEA